MYPQIDDDPEFGRPTTDEEENTTDAQVEQLLRNLLDEHGEDVLFNVLGYDDNDDDAPMALIRQANSFENEGVMTYNRGVVLQLEDGTESRSRSSSRVDQGLGQDYGGTCRLHRQRSGLTPPGIPMGIRVDLIEDQVVERLVADNASFIEHETARAGYPYIVKVGRVGQHVVPSVAHLLASASRGRTQQDRGACARWGHTIAETGRCTVCGQRQNGTLAEIEEGRR